MAAAGVVAVVGLPSLLIRGKWSAIRNSVVVTGTGATLCYGLYKWEEKKRK
uniref:RxLR effector candidate protein n=1 Tax=Hyaloperonospora arabidopsidis (strain Emoy2) TaxID=559515 RepID=M4BR29_HYAAE